MEIDHTYYLLHLLHFRQLLNVFNFFVGRLQYVILWFIVSNILNVILWLIVAKILNV